MSRVLITVVRFCLSAWIGAATLFVVTAIRQVTSEQFDSATRVQMAVLRFPPYYLFGFGLVGLATAGLLVLGIQGRLTSVRWKLATIATITAIGVMLYDYFQVYAPLVALMGPDIYPDTPEFHRLHWLSEAVNTLQLVLVLIAAILTNLPQSTRGWQPDPECSTEG